MRLLFGFVISLIASIFFVGALLLGCETPAWAEAPSAADQATMARGRRLYDAYIQGRSAELWPLFVPKLQAIFGDQAGFDKAREALRQQLGDDQGILGEDVVHQPGVVVYLRHARFSRAGAVDVMLAFDGDARVAGMLLQPQAAAPSTKLDYHTRTALRLPFDGAWTVGWGGRTLEQNRHATARDQRFAYDLLVERGGSSHRGDGKDNRDYYCWGQPVLAPGAGRVIEARDGLPENVPGQASVKEPLGNHVVIDHGSGEFSFVAHLATGSVAVKAGDAVAAGRLLGKCGNSGHSSEPHLHYHLQDSPRFADGDGLPAQFRDYSADGAPVAIGEPTRGQRIEARHPTAHE